MGSEMCIRDSVGRNTFLMILVLSAMQLDMVIRLFGLMVLFGDNGVINGALIYYNIIEKPIGLMYNKLGVVVGLVQFSLPFMILSLVGIIRGLSLRIGDANKLAEKYWQELSVYKSLEK